MKAFPSHFAVTVGFHSLILTTQLKGKTSCSFAAIAKHGTGKRWRFSLMNGKETHSSFSTHWKKSRCVPLLDSYIGALFDISTEEEESILLLQTLGKEGMYVPSLALALKVSKKYPMLAPKRKCVPLSPDDRCISLLSASSMNWRHPV